jgi:peptidoglycan/LPS O-acetylase OafA/YrhL
MRYKNSSGLRASVGAVAAVLVSAVTVFLFESPYTAWGTRTQPAEVLALSVPAPDVDVRNS